MYERQEFVDGLYAFLDYTDPETFRNHIKEGLVVRRCSQNKEEAFERRSIQRWAILEEPENSVEDVTYRFALKLYGYACNSPDKKMRNVFSIAAEFIDKEANDLFRERDGVYPYCP